MTEISRFSDYRDILREAMIELRKKNYRRSLRGIALRMQVNPSFLSLLLAKKRHLEPKKVSLAAEAFGIPESERAFFFLLFLLNQTSRGVADPTLRRLVQAYRKKVKTMKAVERSRCLILAALEAERVNPDPVSAHTVNTVYLK